MPAEPDVVVERRDHIVVWRLNRPERLNAVTIELYQTLETVLGQASHDRDVRAGVITGAGRAFCVGADLKKHRDEDTSLAPGDYIRAGQQTNLALQRFPKPVVAAINGHAIGAGMELALSCDFLIVARDAKLRFPEIGLGTFVGGGSVYRLAERVGVARARELVLSGEVVLGRDAADIGLVTRAVDAGDVLSEAMNMAVALAAKAPISVALFKDVLSRAQQLDPEEAMELEQEALQSCMQTRDWKEGIEAFHEKREPRFAGE